MHAHRHRGQPLRLQVQVERTERLVERGLRRAVRVPPAQAVVRDRPDTGRDVDPLRQGRCWGGRGGGREEAREVLDEEEVRDDVQAEGLEDVVEREVGRLALGVEDCAREERSADVGRGVCV